MSKYRDEFVQSKEWVPAQLVPAIKHSITKNFYVPLSLVMKMLNDNFCGE